MSVLAEPNNLRFFLIGLLIGIVVAVAGGLVEYVLHLRRKREPRFGVPGCLVYMVGGLIVAGVIASIVSLLTTGRLAPALIMGAGVLVGFYTGFMILVGVWLLRDGARAKVDQTLPSDSTLP